MSKAICVYCGSSNEVDSRFFDAAGELGRALAHEGWGLVFGGGTRGLMGSVARGVHESGGHVVAVIPKRLNRPGIVYETADEIIETETLRERKAIMDERADAFVALAGGFGTLEELIEMTALKQLGYHDRAIVVLNTLGYYDTLLAFFRQQVRDGFFREEHLGLMDVAGTPGEVIERITSHVPALAPSKLESWQPVVNVARKRG